MRHSAYSYPLFIALIILIGTCLSFEHLNKFDRRKKSSGPTSRGQHVFGFIPTNNNKQPFPHTATLDGMLRYFDRGLLGNPSTSRFLFSWFKEDTNSGNFESQSENMTKKVKQSQQDGSNSVGNTASMMEKFKRSEEVGIRTRGMIDELEMTPIVGTAASSRVKVFMDGQLCPTGLEIDESLQGEELTSAILSAMQDAHRKFEINTAEKIQLLYSRLGYK